MKTVKVQPPKRTIEQLRAELRTFHADTGNVVECVHAATYKCR